MADERYQWLDQDAAERLLRGEPVDSVDDHARTEAERLAQALATARPTPVARAAYAELPGEAAALAAFRKAAAERGQAVRSAAHASHAPPADLGAVHISRASAVRSWGRSVRYGLAAAVAAVAVGGVAVAAGTGVLPFTTDGPTPAESISAANTPGPISSNDPDSSLSPGPRVDPGTPSAPPAGDGGPQGTSSATPATPPATAASGGTGESGDPGGPGGTGDTTPEPGTSTGPADKGGETEGARLVKACQDFRAGRIDATAKDKLAREARAGETVRRFCDRVLGSSGSGSGSGSSGDTGDGKGDGDQDDDRRTDKSAEPDGKRNGALHTTPLRVVEPVAYPVYPVTDRAEGTAMNRV